ncbi:SRPBCC domain-containing protein [filamentous cyanobacterium CCP1]|nr:SRPBCC domain-containing protein [filamentous cyanobacterium CCP2]PSB68017.1 SRPBCC domain-containing protein [filamentous cyanobacterium CCP1]
MVAKEINTSIEIDAPAEAVWEVLTDFSHYSQWNPFIRSIHGEAKQGETLEVSIQPPGSNGMTFRPVILTLQPGCELRWLGRLLLPGIFDGEHRFQIEPLGENRTRLIHGEVFSGLLVPFLWSSLDKQTRQGFEEMNHALKRQVEQ